MNKRSALLSQPLTAVAAFSADVGGEGEPKTSFRIAPMGEVIGRDGRKFLLKDLAHAQRVVDASLATAGATDIPIDYDHQIPFGLKDGVAANAPASGWVKGLEARADGIWATVEWTNAAAAKIRDKEYRYISPYFGFEKASGAMTRIFNLGLLNFPNFTELAAVASAETDDDTMNLTAIAAALGLAESASAEEIAAAAATLKSASKPDPTKFVPMAAFTELQGQVAAMRDKSLEDAATAAVGAAVASGKITPAGYEHALDMYRASPESFAAFVGSAPVILDPKTVDTRNARENTDPGVLTAEERAAAASVGVSEEAFLASKKELGTR
jgi:phage I-like protein